MIPEVDPGAILPLIVLAAGALLVVTVDAVLVGRSRFLGRPFTEAWRGSLLALLCVCILAGVLALAAQGFSLNGARVFDPGLSAHDRHGLVLVDRLANLGIALVVAAALLTSLASVDYLRELRLPPGSFHALVLLSTLGSAAVACAVDLLTLVVGLELAFLPLQALSALSPEPSARGSASSHPSAAGEGDAPGAGRRSSEAAVKHFLLGAFATALLLFGASLLLGSTGESSYAGIRRGLDTGAPLAMAGVCLVLAGLAFRISAFPFHQWTPDVHQGAPLPVTTLLAVAVRAGAAIGLLRLLAAALDPALERLSPLLSALAAGSLLVGYGMAWVQTDLKRLLAYLVVGQAGFLLMGLAAGTQAGQAAVLTQLLAFLLIGVGTLTALVTLTTDRRERTGLADLRGLGASRPGLAAALTLFAAALAGVPGTVGFVVRFQMLSVGLQSGQVALVAVAGVASLLGFVTCLRIPLHLYRKAPDEAARPLRRAVAGEWLVIGLCAAGVVGLGFVPDGTAPLAPGAEWLGWLPEPFGWSRDAIAALHRGLR